MCRQNRRNKMHGKATLILTDKDTGRVVEQIEEHNMVTNALNSIFSLPPVMAFYQDNRRLFNGYLPMYKNLLKGLVLFGDTIPENAYDYMLGGKYSVLGTAGDEYSGSDAMRGSFNSNQSCEIENGYRFVWDFAPEKAVGTIKSLSLTHRYLGNRGNLALAGADSYYMIQPSDLSNSNNYSIYILSGAGNFFLQKGNTTFYSYSISSSVITVRKYRMTDPQGLKICDVPMGVLESETAISLTFSPTSSYSQFFFDPKSEKLYAINFSYKTVDKVDYFKVRYTAINPETCEKEVETDYILTDAPYNSNGKIAIYDGKMYLSDLSNNINVCSLSGVLERTINTGVSNLYAFTTLDGKLGIDCRFASSGRRSIYIFDEPKTQMMQTYNIYKPIATDIVKYPYCLVSYDGRVYVMFRTDYLATINNLTTPLEKTDQHALQVRYEITN